MIFAEQVKKQLLSLIGEMATVKHGRKFSASRERRIRPHDASAVNQKTNK
ncbi:MULTISPECIES: hypothetical protein [unclassified Ruminococcus]